MHETDSMVMEFSVPNTLESEIDELITHYPEKRSVTLMALHALQAHFGFVSDAGIEWIAQKLDQTPLAVLELVTFYPMFSREPLGKFHFRICRTLSCALNGSEKIYWALCEQLGLDKNVYKRQTTPDGRFTVEFVECLACCNKGPVLFLNEDFHENMTEESVSKLLTICNGDNSSERKGTGK